MKRTHGPPPPVDTEAAHGRPLTRSHRSASSSWIVLSRAERSRTVAEGVSLNDRERVWFEMTEAMMNDLNTSLQRQINQHLRAFVR